MSSRETPTALFVAGRAFALCGPRLDLMRRLVNNGWKVFAAASCDAQAKPIRDAGVTFVNTPFSRDGVKPSRDIYSVCGLGFLLAKLQPQLMHAFNAKATLLSAIAATASPNTKLVNTVTGLGTLFASGRSGNRIGRSALRLATRRFAATVWQCNEDREDLLAQGFRFGNLSRVIVGTGVDTRRFTPRPFSSQPSGVRILMASRLLHQKGVVDYVDAARRTRSTPLAPRFCLAGPYDFSHPDAVDKDWFDKATRDGVIEYVGEINNMASELPGYSFAVLPSHREGTPRFLMEAAACGLPVVTTDAPGCRETVLNGSTGVSVPVGDAEHLSRAIMELAGDSETCSAMGRAGREFAVKKFDMRSINERYMQLYQDLQLPVAISDSWATDSAA